MSIDIPFGTFPEELPKEPIKVTAFADCENKGRQLHEVRVYQTTEVTLEKSPGGKERVLQGGREEELTFQVDEPLRLGGEGKYPQPLSYIAGGVGT